VRLFAVPIAKPPRPKEIGTWRLNRSGDSRVASLLGVPLPV